MGDEKEYKLIRVERNVANTLEMMRLAKQKKSMNSLLDDVSRDWMVEYGYTPVQYAAEFGIFQEDESDETFDGLIDGLEKRDLDIHVELGGPGWDDDDWKPQFVICYESDKVKDPSHAIGEFVLARHYMDYPTYRFSFGKLTQPFMKITDNIKAKDLDFIKSFEITKDQ